MTARLTVRAPKLLTPEGVVSATIHVRDGVIERIGSFEDEAGGESIELGEGDLVMPGLVDPHVHVNEPGRTDWEGFETATRAAAAGGITTIVDMPLNSIPATTTVDALHRKVEALKGKCHVDVGLWGGAVPGNSGELVPMLREGALGFKCFLVESGVEEFGHLDETQLEVALRELAQTGAPLLVHAELPGPIDRADPRGRPEEYDRYLGSRPAQAEVEAIALVARLCAASGAWGHVVHLSAADALPVILQAKKSGTRLTAETTPHYLHFAAESIPNGATEYKCAPPIRDAANRERLWEAMEVDLIEMIASDHSPCTPELKRREEGDFLAAWGGIASLQLLLPVVWTGARRRDVGVERLLSWLCRAPAALAGLEKRKGTLAPGYDADFVVWSPEAELEVDGSRLHHRHAISPYHGERLQGLVRQTWLRGEKIFDNGTFGTARGRWLRGRGSRSEEWTGVDGVDFGDESVDRSVDK